MELNINDTVIYGATICTLTEIAKRDFGGGSQHYYILKPIFDVKTTIYAPIGNPATADKMRRLLSREEIYALIDAMPDEDVAWIDDDTLRRASCKEILSGGDRTELAGLIKTLYLRSRELADGGIGTKSRKLHAIDGQFLKDAERMLYQEFAYVLKIEPEEVLAFIDKRIALKELAARDAEFDGETRPD
ncbi:MAG: CarD family transcriptional regulator [Oscillospiraceae bacterium]|jgi:CarD family transcriptional regulator|nr:CarD family transcriptional regulator [Oscillospiraceae bacterium]